MYIKIYNTSAVNLFNYQINNGSGFKVPDTQNWEPGIYTVLLTDNRKLTRSIKIIISH